MWVQIGNKVSEGLGTASLEVCNSAHYSYHFYYTLEESVWFLCETKYWEKILVLLNQASSGNLFNLLLVRKLAH